MNALSRALALIALVGLAGCGHLGHPAGPAADVAARLIPAGPSPWTEDFGDPVLAALLHQGDRAGLTPKLALARLETADAEVRAAGVGRTPSVVVGLDGAVGGQAFDDVRVAGAPAMELRQEIDVWGRLAQTRMAARAERLAAADDVSVARLQLAAEIARGYLALGAARRDLVLASRREALARTGLELATSRRRGGTAATQDLAARRLTLVRAQDAADAAQRRAALEMARLSDLTGGPVDVPADAAAGEGRWEGVVEPVASGQVDARPDIKAAYARFQAADATRAAAVAAARPQFRIAVAVGAPDASIATLLDVRALTWAAAMTLTHELLDGGARKARIAAARGAADEAELTYRQAVLSAWQELRESLAKAEAARRDQDAATQAAEAAHAAATLSEVRHAAGVVDGLGLAEARLAALEADQTLIEAGLQARLARVSLVLARGGA